MVEDRVGQGTALGAKEPKSLGSVDQHTIHDISEFNIQLITEFRTRNSCPFLEIFQSQNDSRLTWEGSGQGCLSPIVQVISLLGLRIPIVEKTAEEALSSGCDLPAQRC